jgi:hypothetical protein
MIVVNGFVEWIRRMNAPIFAVEWIRRFFPPNEFGVWQGKLVGETC